MSKIFPTGSFRKNVSLTLITATIAFGCFLMPVSALAAATVTSASGGVNISIDKTSADGSGIYTAVSGPGITEQIAGDIAIGTHTITLPSGWEFDTSSTINIFTIGNIVLDSSTITPSPTSFSFVVTSISTSPSILGFSGLKVVPTGTAPSTGEMTYSGAGIAGVSGSTNFGTLSTVAGAVTQLAFTTQPGGAVYGSNLDPQPVVKTQDQFGNDSVSGLGASKIVALTLTSGTGALQGTASLDIGTGAGNGAATFTDLTVDEFGTGKQLTASADGLASDISSDFEITKKPITATLTVGNKTYDGTTAATITGVELVDVEAGDDVTVDDEGTATFDIKDVGEDKLVSSDGVIIIGADALNYIFDGTATGVADITPLGITITPTAGQTKVYGNADPIFAYTPTPALISPDTFFGVLSRVTGENVGIYDYTLGNLSAGDNYTLTFVPGTFEVTQRTLIVTATGINKVYDSSTTATVTLSDDRVDGDDIILGYTATFSDKNVANDKIVSVSSISITGGTDAGNYTLGNTTAATTADITSKLLIVSFTTDANKTYNGSVTAAITGRSLVGVIGVEDVDVTGGSATFEDKDIGLNRTVTATGFALTGDDAGNYIIGTINTTTGNVNPRPITITAVTDDRTYDGTTGSDETPVVTSSFSPPVAVVDGANFVQAYNNKNVGAGKILTPTGTVNDGNSGANYSYTFVTDTTGVITPKSINVTAQSDTKIYDGTDSSDETPVVGALETGDAIDTAPTQEYDTKDVGTDKTLTASGLVVNDGNSGDNYDIIYLPNGTGVINAKGLIVSGATTDSKTYDGDVNAIVDFDFAGLTGVVSGEELLVTLNSADYSAAFDNKNVNVGKTVTISGLALAGVGAGNYSLTQPVLTDGAITPATLIVTAEGTTKEYDSTLDATAIVTLSDNRVLGDDLTFGYTAAFTDKNVGDDKTVNVTGITITGGTDAGNYTLGNTTAATTADITPATLTATITVSNKTYDATIDATITGRTLIGVLGSDDVALNTDGIAMFADENVGTGKVVSATDITTTGLDAGNYTYDGSAATTADITTYALTVTAVTSTKVYNGTTNAAATPIITLGSLQGSDSANFIETYDNKNVGTVKTLTPTGAVNDGNSGANYSYAFVDDTTGVITAITLTGNITVADKIYDATTAATITDRALNGIILSEDVVATGGAATFDNKDVGDDKDVTATGIDIIGTDAGNYTYDGNAATTADITPATLTATIIVSNKTYDATIDATITGRTLIGVLGSDDVALNTDGIAMFADENVGTGKVVSATDITTTGLDAGNYTYDGIAEGTANITAALVTVTADAQAKSFGDLDPALTYQVTSGSLLGGDVFTGSLTRDPGEALGSYSINQGTLTAGTNYDLTYVSALLAILDTTAPLVISKTPSANAVGISPSTNITVTFNEDVVVEDADVTITPGNPAKTIVFDSETGIATINPDADLNDNTTYTITLDGVTDTAGNPLPITIWSFTTAASYSIDLTTGWNLISLPVVPVDTDASAVLGALDDVATIQSVFTYDAINEEWLVYHPDSPETSDFSTMNTGNGYWVDYLAAPTGTISGTGNLFLEGANTPPQKELAAGWNLVGYYQLENTTDVPANAALSTVDGQWTQLRTYDNMLKQFQSVGGGDDMSPGQGYWIFMKSSTIGTYIYGPGDAI